MNLTLHESGPRGEPTLVFLHGLGVSSWMWQDQINALNSAYHCIGIDLPGNGDSHHVAWHSITDTTRQIANIIRDHATGGKAHLVGLSLGGYVSIRLLADFPERVHSAIASGITMQPIVRPSLVRPLTRLTWAMLQIKPIVHLSGKMMRLPPQALELHKRDVSRLSKETVTKVYHEILSASQPAGLAAHAERLLLVGGNKEAKAVLSTLKNATSQLPSATVVLAPNAHHGWNAEHPELFTRMIRAVAGDTDLPSELKPVDEVL